jgi:CRISPR-associated protein Csm5
MATKLLDQHIEKTYQTAVINLQTLSPVFVGGGEESQLNRSKYILNNSYVYVLDENKWLQYLFKNNLFREYADFMKEAGKQLAPNRPGKKPKTYTPDLSTFIREHGLKPDLDTISQYFVKSDLDRSNNIIAFIKNSEIQPYIPGSSIKGAIRTAIIAELIKKQLKHNEKDQIKKKIYELKFEKQVKHYKSSFIDEILTGLAVKTDNKMVKNIMRIIQVSDSVSTLTCEDLQIYKKQDILITKKIPPTNGIPLYREYLKPERQLKFQITIDNKLVELVENNSGYVFKDLNSFFENIIFKYYSDLLEDTSEEIAFKKDKQAKQTTTTFSNEDEWKKARTDYVWDQMKKKRVPTSYQTQKIKDFEKDFENEYPKPGQTEKASDQNSIKLYNKDIRKAPNFNIGGGNGFNTKIILKALAEDDDEYLRLKKHILGLRYPSHHHNEEHTKFAPLYLKLANNYTIGWCHLEVQ